MNTLTFTPGRRAQASSFMKIMLAAVIIFCSGLVASAADKLDLTDPAVIEEGLTQAETALANVAKKIDEIQQPEELMQLERILNPIELRKVRKKYGKIELTDEMRPRLVAANMLIVNSMSSMLSRLSAPMEVREEIAKQMSEENITKEVAKAKTLRDTLE